MKIECLEPRMLLTGTFTTYDAGLKKITVNATSGNDTIIISLSAGNTMSVSVNGINDYNLGSANSAAVLTLIEVQANGGNDSINLGATTKAILTHALINGGNGADTITGGAGPDEIYGGAGNDSIDGNLGADSISGGADNDTVSYVTRATGVSVNLDLLANDGAAGEGDWVGFGTTDVESVMGGSGNDTLTGDSLGNYISGGSGADMIHGSAGSDTMVGGAGGDSLYGDDDADFIFARDGEFDVIDGGPGIDSADVDTSPVEAPLPEAPVPGALPALKPVAASTFSTRRVGIRPRAGSGLTAAAPLPLPPPDDNVEETINPQTLPLIIQPLDPYCVGQVLVVRDKQGSVTVDGTSGDDTFVITTQPGTAGVQISNNGGFTDWPLPSNPIVVNGNGGNDVFTVSGGNVLYTPGSAAGTVVTSDGHTIIFNGASPNNGPTFSNVATLTLQTSGSNDSIQLGQSPIGVPTVGGSSDGTTFAAIPVDGVQFLALDLGTNNQAPSNDTVVADNFGPNAPPIAILTKGAAAGQTNLVVGNGLLNLANDPGADPSGQFIVEVSSGGQVRFHAPVTHVGLFNLQGTAELVPDGSHVLVVGSLNLNGPGTLDLEDNTLIHSPPSGSPPSTQLAGLVAASHQKGWHGPGLASSVAAADSRLAIGYADAVQLFGPAGGVYKGVNVKPGDAIATVTLRGDSDLDGSVAFTDLVSVAQHYGQPVPNGWISGDSNYDGVVDFEDLVAVAQNYGPSLGTP